MNKKMTWEEVKRVYPDEWVALTDYHTYNGTDVDGTVVVHHSERTHFRSLLKSLPPHIDNISVRYTGVRIKNPELPLLWQITNTSESGN